MFPLVQILHSRGYKITGSDVNYTDTVETERGMGIDVVIGQKAENIEGADLIVYTAAILPDNEELIAAKNSTVPAVERAALLAVLSAGYENCICVAGTHGKTTTSSILTEVLMHAQSNPTVVIGGKLKSIGGSGRLGSSNLMVCEACEFSEHHLLLDCDTAIILNIDGDHLEYYKNMDNLIASFKKFADGSSKYVIANGDDKNTMQAVTDVPQEKLITFGFLENNTYSARQVEDKAYGSSFALYKGEEKLADVNVNVPGRHNVLNALASAVAAITTGVSAQIAAEGVEKFKGVGRRFEILGEVNGVTIADDYAHHPAELTATLTAAKNMNYNNVWAVFQPFTFSRTKLLLDDFATALQIADKVVITEIMGGREVNTFGIYADDLVQKVPGAVYKHTFEDIAKYVLGQAQPGDLVLTLGCGDINKCAHMMIK